MASESNSMQTFACPPNSMTVQTHASKMDSIFEGRQCLFTSRGMCLLTCLLLQLIGRRGNACQTYVTIIVCSRLNHTFLILLILFAWQIWGDTCSLT